MSEHNTDPSELRKAASEVDALATIVEAFEVRIDTLGYDLALLHLDTKQLRKGVHDIKGALTAYRSDQEALLDSVRHLTVMVTEIRDWVRQQRGMSGPTEEPTSA